MKLSLTEKTIAVFVLVTMLTQMIVGCQGI